VKVHPLPQEHPYRLSDVPVVLLEAWAEDADNGDRDLLLAELIPQQRGDEP
jgi:hypothetical protein